MLRIDRFFVGDSLMIHAGYGGLTIEPGSTTVVTTVWAEAPNGERRNECGAGVGRHALRYDCTFQYKVYNVNSITIQRTKENMRLLQTKKSAYYNNSY